MNQQSVTTTTGRNQLQPSKPLPAWVAYAAKWHRVSTVPSEGEVTAVRSWQSDLRDRLSSGPDERDAKVKAVGKLYAVLAAEEVPESFMDLRLIAYLEALDDFPAWAVDEGVRRWIKGDWLAEGERRQFVPKPADLIRLIKLAMRPVEDEISRLSIALHAVDDFEPPLPKPAPFTAEQKALIDKAVGRRKAELSRDRFAEMCAEAGVDPADIEDAKPSGKKLGSDWLEGQEKAA